MGTIEAGDHRGEGPQSGNYRGRDHRDRDYRNTDRTGSDFIVRGFIGTTSEVGWIC